VDEILLYILLLQKQGVYNINCSLLPYVFCLNGSAPARINSKITSLSEKLDGQYLTLKKMTLYSPEILVKSREF
jgi:hypothetical protein